MRARLLILVVAVVFSSRGRAEPLSMEPVLGLMSQYSTNPYLVAQGGQAANDVAVLASAPTNYDLDSAHFNVTPSIRYGDGGSYASLASNFYHLTGSASFSSDLDLLSMKAGFGRDSSLYQNGLSSNGIGVRSDSTSASLEWQRAVSERSQFALDAGWSRALYDQGTATTGLVDYRYVSLGPSVSYAVSERDSVRVAAGAGEYQAIDGITKSRNYNLQLGFDRQLSEIWQLSASAGYAVSKDSQKIYYGPIFIDGVEFGPFYLGTVESTQKGPIYNLSLTRHGEQLTLTASAARAYLPSGFNYLSRQDIVQMDLNYIRSERWTFGSRVNYQNTATPTGIGALNSVRYWSAQISADWHWTPTWVVSMHANWVGVKYEAPPDRAQSSSVSLEISRHFLRIDL